MIYLDFAASSPVWPVILEQHGERSRRWFCNPHGSSIAGEEAMKMIVRSERRICELLKIPFEEVMLIWTSGGTEANNLALKSIRSEMTLQDLIIDPTAHPSQLQCWAGCDEFKVNSYGQLCYNDNIADKKGAAVCLVNNEIGTIQEIAEFRRFNSRALLAVDAIQGAWRLLGLWQKVRIDYLTLSGRKIGGPRGIGLLIARRSAPLHSQILGGDQQRGIRSGTLDTVGILEFAEALTLTLADSTDYEALNRHLRTCLEQALGNQCHFLSSRDFSSPRILAFTCPAYQGAILARGLAEHGIVVSTGSACRAESGIENHVLRAMGFGEPEVRGMLRFSFGETTTCDEITQAVEKLAELIRAY